MSDNPLKIPCIVLSAVSVVSMTAAGVMAVNIDRLKNSAVPAEAVVITAPESNVTEAVTSQTTASETAPPTEDSKTETTIPENMIYIYDNGIETIEYPEIVGAKMNDYDMSRLVTDEKKHKFLYDEEGNLISRFGIDVSSYQTKIDWEKVAADGVEFAFLRCGYRGYETGKITEDKYFRRNIEGASAAGLDIGVYFYSQAITPEEAEEEAHFVLDLLSETGDKVTLPIVFDWEFCTDEDPARTDGMTPEMQQQCCEAFCKIISENGKQPMYYATVNTAIFRYDMGKNADIPLWVAEYHAETDFVYDYKMWQYSCSGVIDGIEGLVDLNILMM